MACARKFLVNECLLLFCDIDFPIGGLEPRICIVTSGLYSYVMIVKVFQLGSSLIQLESSLIHLRIS